MSDDLISRKAVINIIKRHWLDIDRSLERVAEIPTAYDVDKVVEQIREYADNVAELGGNFLPQVVIEIVKSGGVADE